MQRRAGRLLIVMVAIALVASSCKGSTDATAPTENTPMPTATNNVVDLPETESIAPFPASIDITLEEGSTVTATIGPGGGSFEAMDKNGTKYILSIPEGALLAEEEITMTPIAGVEGDVISETFLAGVKLEPEGLHFLELVSIEIIGAVMKEGAVGFSTENGGQDFHLIPSKTGEGSLIITTTHFTEFGASKEEIQELGEYISEIGMAWVENQLANSDASQQLTALDSWTVLLLGRGKAGINLNGWAPWTADILSLILRTAEAMEANNWNENSPGIPELRTKMQSLIDLWFQQTDGVVQAIVDKCIQGEIAYLAKGDQVTSVVGWFIRHLGMEAREKQLVTWQTTLETCYHKIVTWQANVVTTGDNFTSDISVGGELEGRARNSIGSQENLEIEYIDGFWEDTCVPREGTVKIELSITYRPHNLGKDSGRVIEDITVYVKILEPVYIDCTPAGFDLPADAQAPFHGAALDRLNEDRVTQAPYYKGSWEFELNYDPGGGVIAQFEEGPETFTWSDGKYELWQMVTVYQATPVE